MFNKEQILYTKLGQRKLFPIVIFCFCALIIIDLFLEHKIRGFSFYVYRSLVMLFGIVALYVLFFFKIIDSKIAMTITVYIVVICVTCVLPVIIKDPTVIFEVYYLKIQMVFLILSFAIGVFLKPVHLLVVIALSIVFNICCFLLTDELSIGQYIYYTAFITAANIIAYKSFTKSIEMALDIQTNNELINQKNKLLSEANDFKNNLIAIIGHDLRTPVEQVNLLMNLMESIDDEKEKNECFEHLKQAGLNASNLLDDVLNWAIDFKKEDIVEAETNVNLKQVIDKVFKFKQKDAKDKQITLINENNESHVCTIQVNTLETILRNLIDNAIKFSFPGGKIEVTFKSEKTGTSIIVRDYGKGISNDILHSIVTNSMTVTTLGTNNEIGTGHGLQICFNLAKRLGGTLNLHKMDKGVQAVLLIPA